MYFCSTVFKSKFCNRGILEGLNIYSLPLISYFDITRWQHMMYDTNMPMLTVTASVRDYSGPCDLRPLHSTIPSNLRPAISDTILIHLQYKYLCILRPPPI